MSQPHQADPARWVLVTGASSGIGLESVRLLAAGGLSVIAGVLEDHAERSLREQGSPRIVPLRFDMSVPGFEREVASRVREIAGEHGPYALVNNAGLAVVGPAETLPIEQLRRIFEVNYFGAVAVTQALLPGLIARPGGARIVNVSSMFGRMSLPFAWPYCASKHALEAWSTGLRMELAATAVRVCTIRPGSVRTPIWENALRNFGSLFWGLPAGQRARYHKILERTMHRGAKMGRTGIDPARVAGAVDRALRAATPRRVYRVGAESRVLAAMQRALPESMMERLTLWRLHAHRATRPPPPPGDRQN